MGTDALIEGDRQFIQRTSASVFTRDRIIAGASRMLEPVQHATLKEEIAEHFSIHPSAVIVVGSAKLGYSLSPNKRYKPFNDVSDIDVAVVDAPLFEKYWLDMYEAKQNLIEWPDIGDARKYLFRGWIRPDKLPLFQVRNAWFDFFTALQSKGVAGPYAIRAGLYYNVRFLEAYQLNGVRQAFSEI